MRDWERIHALVGVPGAPHAWLLTSSEGVRNLDDLERDHLTLDETTGAQARAGRGAASAYRRGLAAGGF